MMNITIPTGSTSATFPITTTPVAANTPVTITASRGGVSKAATLTVKSPVTLNVSLLPSSLTGGTPSTGTVTLSGPAPAGGMTLSLTSNSGMAIVQPSVTVAAGQNTATFSITTKPVAAITYARITALGAGPSKFSTLAIKAPVLTDLTLEATRVNSGTTVIGTVTLNGLAPSNGKGVLLTSSRPDIAVVPRSIVVPAGYNEWTFPVTTQRVSESTQVIITATAAGVVKTLTLTINPPVMDAMMPSSAEMNGHFVDSSRADEATVLVEQYYRLLNLLAG